jgi:hypothetical protein
MSILVDSYNRSQTADYRLRVLNDEFKHDFPLLGQVLCGVLSEDAKTLLLPPSKLTIWAECGSLNCCLIPAVGREKAFLSLGDGLASPWATLEELLSQGVKWVTGSKQKNS